MNDVTGIIEWRPVTGKQGEQMSFKGSEETWTNLGFELLVFNGESLTYYTQSTDKNGRMSLNSQSFDAVSGKPLEGFSKTVDVARTAKEVLDKI